MALFAPLLAFIGRQVGRIVQMAFGWASILLFGRVPQRKQLLLAGVALGSVLWVAALVGVAFPDVGSFLIAFIPVPDFVDEAWIRLAMLALAILLPIGVGLAGLFLMHPDDRPAGIGGRVVQILRGYPYAAVLSLVIVFLLLVAPIFKLRTIIKRWEDAHVPIVIPPGAYEQVAGELEGAVEAAGLELTRRRAPRVLEVPSKLLAAVGGASVRRLVPDQLIMLKGAQIQVSIHPADIALVGSREAVARSRAAIADRLTETDAHLTSSAEGQQVEDIIRALRGPRADGRAEELLPALDQRLARLVVPYEEWEVLYRQRLQLERDLLRGRCPPDEGGSRGPGILAKVAGTIRQIGR